jgi:3-mercaptopyruvate sulfurtransferase SseA
VLEWRVDPDSGHTNPHVGGLERQIVLFCADGYSSSLAAATLLDIGCAKATDIVGGFTAWKASGLPIRRATSDQDANELPGMGPPEPFETSEEAEVSAPRQPVRAQEP